MTESSEIVLPRAWGWCMASKTNAEAFRDVLEEASFLRPEGVRYLELGLGNCGTINAVDFILSQIPGCHEITGIEHTSWTMAYLMPYRGRLIIREDNSVPDEMWEVCLIDACHCKACVKADFEAVKDRIVPGGFVIFHDVGEDLQGEHKGFGAHQVNGIEVLAAINECDLSNYSTRKQTPDCAPLYHGIRIYQRCDSSMMKV